MLCDEYKPVGSSLSQKYPDLPCLNQEGSKKPAMTQSGSCYKIQHTELGTLFNTSTIYSD